MKDNRVYSTSQIAKLIGVHPNTVRLYEKLGLIAPVMRKKNGYRVFTDLHIKEFEIARIALRIEVLQNGLRKKSINIVKSCAKGDFDQAIALTEEYISDIENEISNAYEAVNVVGDILSSKTLIGSIQLKRSDVAHELGITIDSLRNWEMNGLLDIKRSKNGYRIYTEDDICRIKIIRTLKCANYSLSAILRLMRSIDSKAPCDTVDVTMVLNTPDGEDIISVCDKLIASLESAKSNALDIRARLILLQSEY